MTLKTTNMEDLLKDIQADVADANDTLDQAIADLKEAVKWVEEAKEMLDKNAKDLDLFKKDHSTL